MAYVEVKAKTVELAVEAAMRELGVTDRERIEVKVLQEPERGFLGMGGRDAIVKVEESRSGKRSRNRSKGGRKGGGGGNGGGSGSGQSRGGQSRGGRGQSGERTAKSSSGSRGGDGAGSQPRPAKAGGERSKGNSGDRGRRQDQGGKRPQDEDRDALGISAQEPLVANFLSGLVTSFGLEGQVETRIDDDVIIADVSGDQTEALVGPRGSVMEAVHELTKTVLQRTAQDSARVRIDIAGYASRRRQALSIYAGDLIEQVLGDGGEIMLEPMSASDRKVIHDAVGERPGVRSYSEGESPSRYVVIAATESASTEAAPAPEAGASEEE